MKTNLTACLVSLLLHLGARATPPAKACGTASWYGESQRTATGARYRPDGLTAAHRTLPLGTKVKITNLHNQRSVTVIINDRGPYRKGRIIDVSRGAAVQLQMLHSGLAQVEISQVSGE